MNLAIKLTSTVTVTMMAMIAFLWFGWPAASLMALCGGIGITIITILSFVRGKGLAGWYPDLERRAEILVLSTNKDEITQFLYAKQNYLSPKSFKMLLNRIEALQADQIIFEDQLKTRIETLTPEKESCQELVDEYAQRDINRNR